MANVVKYVGIDISKDRFEYFFLSDAGKPISGSSRYSEQELTAFLGKLGAISHCVMEATGIYHLRLAVFLHANGIAVSVINPLVIKRYGQMSMSRTKTDKSDAKLIHSYALLVTPSAWEPDPIHSVELQQLCAYERLLIKQRTALNNHLLSIRHCPHSSVVVVRELELQLADIDRSIAAIDAERTALVQQHYAQEFACMTSIPGVGRKTAVTLLAMVKGFEDFKNAKQVCSYFGLAPRIFQSGSSINGKAKICKLGMGRIRQLLYMCARSASRYNTACKNLYERLLGQGKPKKLALIAVTNKLVKQLFAIVKRNQKYSPNYENKFAY